MREATKACSTTSRVKGRIEPKRGQGLGRSISFKEKPDVKNVPKLSRSQSDDLFWNDDELDAFRNEAFMESCGLDPADFEGFDQQ
jgi:hypothetical protein